MCTIMAHDANLVCGFYIKLKMTIVERLIFPGREHLVQKENSQSSVLHCRLADKYFGKLACTFWRQNEHT